MQIELNILKKDKELIGLEHINIIYGHSNSGKTTILKKLSDGFSGKLKKEFLIDEKEVKESEYNVIHIDAIENLVNQSKIKSKNYFQELVTIYFKDLNEPFAKTQDNFKSFLNGINNNTLNGNLNLKLDAKTVDEIFKKEIEYLFGENENKDCSTSVAKELLYSILYKIVQLRKEKTIIILDNFDSEFDEEVTINVINNILTIDNENITFILSSNKPTSLPYLINKANIFAIKEKSLLNFKAIYGFLNNINSFDQKYHTFEEYMIYNKNDKINIDEEINLLNKNIIYNLGRLITSKNYIISKSNEVYKDKIVIYPTSLIEEIFYQSIENYIHKNT